MLLNSFKIIVACAFLSFGLVVPSSAEVEATLAEKYNFEKEKGIKWSEATDKTKLRWMEGRKQVKQGNKAQVESAEEAARKARLQQADMARKAEKQEELARKAAREAERKAKREALAQKRRELAQRKLQMMEQMKALKNKNKSSN